MKQVSPKYVALSLLLILFAWGIVPVRASVALAQQPEEENSRRFWPPSYRPAAEPGASSNAGAAAKPRASAGNYKRVAVVRSNSGKPTAGNKSGKSQAAASAANQPLLADIAGALPANSDIAALGVTFWRLRPERATEKAANNKAAENARILVTVNGKREGWVPERVEAATKFTYGQMLRLSVEVPRTGYLYVIDREAYQDGTLGPPYLIFPLDPAQGGNRVTAGRVIELPNQNDAQAVFRFEPPANGAQAIQAEWLTLLVTPAPLTGLPASKGDGAPLPLDAAQVEQWEAQYGQLMEQLELQNGAGRSYTVAEKKAGGSAQPLTAADPLPQTIFRIAAKPGQPFVVRVPLQIGQ